MIEHISEKIAIVIKTANPEETNSVAVMKYQLSIFIHLFLGFTLCYIAGVLTGEIHKTLITFASFVIIRFFSGGKHLKTLEGCLLVSTILISIIPHIGVHPRLINPINIFNALTMLLCAPLIKGVDTVTKKATPYLKVISIILVCSNFYFQSDLFALAFLSQSLLLIFWRR
jgi:accessory gene regulator B